MRTTFKIALASLSFAVSGCGEETGSAPTDAEAAIAAFQEQALLLPEESIPPGYRQFVFDTIKDREHLHARLMTIRACFERIDGSLSPSEREDLVLFGKIGDLRDQPGDCWEIMSFGGFGNGIEGYLEADTGKLLLLWIVPEG